MKGLRFTKTHEWINLTNQAGVIGITDYAQSQLGDIVFIELPRLGEKIKQSSKFGTIESTKAASELYSPVSGEVIAINKDLINNPQWINESPFENGWMLKIKIENPQELEQLMDEVAYQNFIKEESH
ncbi:MAG: glycine cleavage system protein GcvH [Candidatus Omnitrophica bacterium]|jgi:glycine cleavage system H protein|nr:glycine cleavage system protein GcvH [Candidatus Omnitrophota bacterium]